MASVVAEFFQITGVDAVPPTNMAELIPYLLTVFISVVLVVCVFRIVGAIRPICPLYEQYLRSLT